MPKTKFVKVMVIGLIVLTCTIVALAIAAIIARYITKPKTSSVTSISVKADRQAQLDPLAIDAIRSKQYPGSPITTEQELGDQGGYTHKIVSFQADSLKEYALVSTPSVSPPEGGWPIIILNHGYINPPDYQTNGGDYKSIIAPLVNAGFVVIKPDYRGHGNSQGTPEGGHFSPVYAYDELNLITSLKNYPGINPERIGILGHSLGGHVAARTIVSSPHVKATAIMAGVVGDFNDIINNWPHSPMPNDRPLIVQTKKQEYLQKYGNPKDNPTIWNTFAALNYASSITGLVLVIHDQDDSTVPKAFSDHFVSALQAAHKPVDYKVYPGDDHQFIQNRGQLLNDLINFYKLNL